MVQRPLVDISGKTLDLGISEKFLDIYQDPKANVQIIIDEMNKEEIYKNIFDNKNDLRILDIGGNIGLFALFIYPKASKIISVEPTPYHIEIYKDIIDKLGYDKISIVEGAAAKEKGKMEFFINVTNPTMNSLNFVNEMGYDKKIEVDTYSMIDLIEMAGFDEVDFIKLDIEGGEERVLYSNDFKKAAKKIKSIYVEVHQGLGSNLNNVLYRLDEVGFDKVILTPYSPNQGVYAEKS